MGKLTRAEYRGTLSDVLVQLGQNEPVDVYVCGMAGARQGWMEAPYLDAPTDLRDLAKGAVHPEAGGLTARVSILPGVCQRQGGEDVMRGEETQLLGLAAIHPGYAGLVCMPGTHSKWALLDGTTIRRFNTAMTGEMFEILKTHSVLRHSLAGELDGPDRADGFAAGAADGLEKPQSLLGQLFGVRASALLSDRKPDWCAGYLSGLLIGTEIAAQRHDIGNDAVPLIGSTGLCALYAQVLEMAGFSGRPVDATSVVLAGLTAARNAIN
jgi:2-dehydro-3-deoxygalactonokinase